MVRLKATLPNDHGLLWPGQFVNARLLVETRAQTVTVPATAVQRSAQGDTLFVVQDDSTVAPRQIVVGAMDGAAAEIIDGVSAGETVVTAGHYRLHPGVKVAANLATAAASRSTP
jgi:multidrug efflux system membrane fusion protein